MHHQPPTHQPLQDAFAGASALSYATVPLPMLEAGPAGLDNLVLNATGVRPSIGCLLTYANSRIAADKEADVSID